VRALPYELYIDLADQTEFLSFAKDPGGCAERYWHATARPRRDRRDSARAGAAEHRAVAHRSVSTTAPIRVDRVECAQLKRGGANLLPGRIIVEWLDPLSVVEVGAPVDLDRGLRLGMLPGIYWGDDEAPAVLGTYADVYLQEEIRAEALAKDLGGYARFLDVSKRPTKLSITHKYWRRISSSFLSSL